MRSEQEISAKANEVEYDLAADTDDPYKRSRVHEAYLKGVRDGLQYALEGDQ